LRLPSRSPEDPITTLPVAKALTRIESGDKSILRSAVKHPEPEVRSAALEKLRPFAAADATVLELLQESLGDRDDRVRATASETLVALGRLDKAAGPIRLAMKADLSPSMPNDQPVRCDRYGDPLPPGALARLGTARLRHSDTIVAITFSPDGKWLASGGDHTVRVWEVSSGKEIRQWRGEFLFGGQVVFSPDSKTLLLSEGNAIHYREIATGKEVRRIAGEHALAIGDFALSPDGKLIARSGSRLGIVTVDALTGELIRSFTGSARGGKLQFSPDGRCLLCGGNLWDVATGNQVVAVPVISEFQTSATLSSDGKILATSHSDFPGGNGEPARFEPSVRYWDGATGKQLDHFKEDQKYLYQVAFSPDGKWLAVTGNDAFIRLWDATHGKEVHRLLGSFNYSVLAVFSPNGQHLAATDRWNRILIWELSSGKLLHPLHEDEGFIKTVAYSPDGKTIAAAGDATIRLREATTGKPLRELRGHTRAVASLAYSPDGQRLVSGGAGADETTRVWDAATGKELQRFSDNGGWVAVSPDGQFLATGSNPLRLRALASGEEISKLAYQNVRSLRFAPVGSLLVADREVWQLKFSEPTAGKGPVRFELLTLQHPHADINNGLAYSPDGCTLASVTHPSPILFLHIDPQSGKRSRYCWDKSSGSTAVAFAPKGKTMAIGWWDGLVALCGTETAREEARYDTRQGAVKAIAFSPDGQSLTAVYSDGSALVWDIKDPHYR
jgi:WD40 repeat protein